MTNIRDHNESLRVVKTESQRPNDGLALRVFFRGIVCVCVHVVRCGLRSLRRRSRVRIAAAASHVLTTLGFYWTEIGGAGANTPIGDRSDLRPSLSLSITLIPAHGIAASSLHFTALPVWHRLKCDKGRLEAAADLRSFTAAVKTRLSSSHGPSNCFLGPFFVPQNSPFDYFVWVVVRCDTNFGPRIEHRAQ